MIVFLCVTTKRLLTGEKGRAACACRSACVVGPATFCPSCPSFSSFSRANKKLRREKKSEGLEARRCLKYFIRAMRTAVRRNELVTSPRGFGYDPSGAIGIPRARFYAGSIHGFLIVSAIERVTGLIEEFHSRTKEELHSLKPSKSELPAAIWIEFSRKRACSLGFVVRRIIRNESLLMSNISYRKRPKRNEKNIANEYSNYQIQEVWDTKLNCYW